MRRSLATTAVTAAAGTTALALLAACSSPPRPAPSTTGPHTAALSADERSSAILDVLTGTTALTIKTADFGASGSLLRVSTPAGGPPPQLRVNGTSQPGQSTAVDLSASGAAAVTVTLNTAVSWWLNLGGGTTRTDADLRGTEVTGVAFTAGSDVISLTLPRPHGTVPVQLAGGASQFLLSVPGGVPVQLIAAGGAGEVSLLGQEHAGVAGGSVLATPGWAPGADGYDVDATAGASLVSVTARAR
jgi:hypothetical protein